MPFSIDKAVATYKEHIDQLIAEAGKTVRLFYEDPADLPDSSFEDQVHHSQRKPSWKNPDNATPTFTTEDIKALVSWNPSDLAKAGIVVSQAKSVVRLKTFLSDIPKLQRATFITPNIDSDDTIGGKYELIQAPVPVGLQVDRYALSWWKRVQ